MKCRRLGCGSPARPIVVEKGRQEVARGVLCDVHFQQALDGAEALRLEFESLLAEGVSREVANEFLISKINAVASS